MKHILIIYLFCISIFFVSTQESQSNSFAPENIKLFADTLFLNGFIEDAESEYKRYLFYSENNNSEVILSLANIYDKTENLDGINWLYSSFYQNTDLNVKIELTRIESKMIYSTFNSQLFKDFSQNIDDQIKFSSTAFTTLIPLSQSILDNDIQLAQNILEQNKTDILIFKNTTELCTSYKKKSPATAVLLSAILPGAGRWYTGSFKGGLSVFLTAAALGTSIWFTADKYGWENWRPWLFSGMALFTYSVELYGAGKSAIRINNYKLNQIKQSVRDVYDSI